MSNLIAFDESHWCTRREAADYLRFDSPKTLDARLTKETRAVPGRIRARVFDCGGKRKVRLWRRDVIAMLPPFES